MPTSLSFLVDAPSPPSPLITDQPFAQMRGRGDAGDDKTSLYPIKMPYHHSGGILMLRLQRIIGYYWVVRFRGFFKNGKDNLKIPSVISNFQAEMLDQWI